MHLPLVNTPTFHGTVTFDPSATFGEDVVIWQYATICAHARVGRGVVIGSGAWIGAYAILGEETRIQHGVFIPNRTIIGARVFIGPGVMMTDDKYPKVNGRYDAQPPILEDDCSIGAGAVLLPGVRIGHHAMVGAGAVVCHDVAPHRTVTGCPAVIQGGV